MFEYLTTIENAFSAIVAVDLIEHFTKDELVHLVPLIFKALKKGTTIVKYGAPIGVATQDIAPGDSMHIHNVTSDYIPTYTLDEGHQFFKEGH